MNHMPALVHWIIGEVALDAFVIVDLAGVQADILDVDQKYAHVVHEQLPSVPCLERCHDIWALGGRRDKMFS